MTIKQGDAYDLPIKLYINKTEITEENLDIMDIKQIEFILGELKAKFFKNNQSNEVKFSNGYFMYPLTQEESFSLQPGRINMDIRVQFNNTNVRGITTKIDVKIADATSTEVLI